MDLIEQCYSYLFWGALVVLAVGILAALVYIIRARLTVDRIIGINLVGTFIVVMVIVVLTFLLGRGLSGGHRPDLCGAVVYRRDDALPHLHQSLSAQSAEKGGGVP